MSRGSRRTSSARQSRWAILPAALLVAATAAAAPASASAANPCPAQAHYDWMGDSVLRDGLDPVAGPADRDHRLRRHDPAPRRRRRPIPGPRPVVLIQHGLGGNQCANWWTAQDLAGHGYIAVVWTAPQGSSPTQAFGNAVDAMRSALAFVRTPVEPLRGPDGHDPGGARRPLARLDRGLLRTERGRPGGARDHRPRHAAPLGERRPGRRGLRVRLAAGARDHAAGSGARLRQGRALQREARLRPRRPEAARIPALARAPACRRSSS